MLTRSFSSGNGRNGKSIVYHEPTEDSLVRMGGREKARGLFHIFFSLRAFLSDLVIK